MSDRGFRGLMLGVLIVGIVYTAVTLLSIQSSDIQVVVQYSGIGESHFYRNQWTYLYIFSIFGVLVTIGHLLIMAKLYNYESRNAGIIFGYSTMALLVIAFIMFKSVTQLAFL